MQDAIGTKIDPKKVKTLLMDHILAVISGQNLMALDFPKHQLM
jgi:hypothetical protein